MASAEAETQPMPKEIIENVEDTLQEEEQEMPRDRKQKQVTKIND